MTLSEMLRAAADALDAKERKDNSGAPAYELMKPVPGLPSGVVFIHDKYDSIKGSPAHGCLKLAWDNGNCQADWCAETHIFPGQLSEDREWFKPIKNNGRYSVDS